MNTKSETWTKISKLDSTNRMLILIEEPNRQHLNYKMCNLYLSIILNAYSTFKNHC